MVNSDRDSYRIAAYITAYEDAQALNACLNSLQAQTRSLDQIFIVDNSRNPLPLEPQHAQNPALRVFHHPENIGIAAGIRFAVELALKENYDFLWTFDQDSQPKPKCLETLIQAYVELDDPEIAIVAPKAVDARTGETVEPARFLGDRFEGYKAPSETQPFECDAPITSGSLVWLKTAETVPTPDPKLFIDGVDLDYGLRLRRAGFKNYVVPTAVMNHRFGEPVMIRFLIKKVIQIYSPLRHYYICRNHTYLELGHSQGRYRLSCSLKRINYAIRKCIMILLFEPKSKLKKLVACIIGTYHGFRGDLSHSWRS